jgi:hypothetical protein
MQLYAILELHLPNVHRVIHYPEILTDHHQQQHIFAGANYYHQRTDLFMGNALFSSLANIYLGFLEKEIVHRSPSLLHY